MLMPNCRRENVLNLWMCRLWKGCFNSSFDTRLPGFSNPPANVTALLLILCKFQRLIQGINMKLCLNDISASLSRSKKWKISYVLSSSRQEYTFPLGAQL